MKTAFMIAVGILVALVISTQMPATPDVVEQASSYFSAEEIAAGQDFAWQRRWIFWGNAMAQLLLLGSLALWPIGRRLHDTLGERVNFLWFSHIIVLAGFYWIASILVSLPFRVASYLLQRSWEMTDQPLGAWLGDQGLHIMVSGLLEGVAFLGLYQLMRAAPRYWWALGGLGALAVGFVYAYLLPVLVDPLFNTFTPLRNTPWADLEPRLKAMAKRAEASTSDIYVVDASRQSRHANAYFTGVGSNQRIVLYDNLLKNHSADEVATVVGHELGHWWHMHILQGLGLGGLGVTAGLYLLARYLNRFVESGRWSSVADPDGVFLVLLLLQVGAAVSWPLQAAVSRQFEKEADRAALEFSHAPQAFVDAEKRLARLNKTNVAPSRLNVLLLATHPPVVDRIHMAEEAK